MHPGTRGLHLSNFRSYSCCFRYLNLRIAHALWMPGTFSPPPRVSDPDMHHGTCVTHVPWCMPQSLTSGFLWSLWWGKRSRQARCMCNPEIYISGKRPIVVVWQLFSAYVCLRDSTTRHWFLVNIHPCNCLPDDTDSGPNALFSNRQSDPTSII